MKLRHCLIIALLAGCASDRRPRGGLAPTMPSPTDTVACDMPGVHNLVAFAPGFISGSAPEGPEGFDTLRALGVRTIVSVDGAIPDAEAASSRGIRTIHLPIGYDGFDDERRRQLARAVRDGLRDGPVYIHCHHGKHRSAGAAAAVASALSLSSVEHSRERMAIAGTSPSYPGLFACAAESTPLSESEIDAVSPDLPAASMPTGVIEGMLELDAALDRLREVEHAGWRAPVEHPDLVPAAEAGRLTDVYRVLLEADASGPEIANVDFSLAMDEASALEDAIVRGDDAGALSIRLARVAASCKDCHVRHRDPRTRMSVP